MQRPMSGQIGVAATALCADCVSDGGMPAARSCTGRVPRGGASSRNLGKQDFSCLERDKKESLEGQDMVLAVGGLEARCVHKPRVAKRV